MNRALQLRVMDGLRKRLAEGAGQGLPSVDRLVSADALQLCEIGSGRLGAVAVVVADASSVEAVTQLVQSNVRRTDLLLTQADDTLLVLAPGLDPVGGQSLTARLERLLHECLAGTPAGLPTVGAAYRSPLSLSGWEVAQLADEARRRALSAREPLEHVT